MSKSRIRDEHTPILVGTAQLALRDVDPSEAVDPIRMIEGVARQAADDGSLSDTALRKLDTIALLNLGREMQNPPRLVAERLQAKPTAEYIAEHGGQIGVTVANTLARRIARGESRMALLAGCNQLRTMRKAREQGVALGWPTGGEGAPKMLGKLQLGNSELEERYGLERPPEIYPLFENALRAARGLSLTEHRQRIGELFSRFTEVAAANPHAWFPKFRSPEEIITVTPENRMVAYPYTKYLNAVLDTDQAAALLMTSVAEARSLGIPEDRWIYWWGGAQAVEEAWWVSERPSFAECPAMRDVARNTLDGAGVSIGDVEFIDFYSCFPVAVELAAEQLGLAEDDPRGFTVTGGLPYAGGPASAYCLHSISSMVDRLREQPGAKGLTTGNGWYLTKHSAALWASEPWPGGAPSEESPDTQHDDGARAPIALAEAPAGRGRVETYTVLYDREGAPVRGIVLGRTETGDRFLANTPAERDLLESFVAEERVGSEGRLSEDGDLCRFEPR